MPGLPEGEGGRVKAVVYVCAKCGAVCRQLWWAALGLEKAEEKCPACGRWAEFRVREERAEKEAKAA